MKKEAISPSVLCCSYRLLDVMIFCQNRSKKRIVNLLYGLRIERNVDFLLDDVDGGNDIFVDGLLREREGFPKNIQERITTDETDEMIFSSFRLG